MKLKTGIVNIFLLLLLSVCVLSESTIASAHANSSNAGGIGGKGSGTVNNAKAWGFRIIPIDHRSLYKTKSTDTRYGDVDRKKTYIAASGIADDGQNMKKLTNGEINSHLAGVILCMDGDISSGKDKNTLAIAKTPTDILCKPISVYDKSDKVWQDEVTGGIYWSKDSAKDAKHTCHERTVADALLYNPVEADYDRLKSMLNALKVNKQGSAIIKPIFKSWLIDKLTTKAKYRKTISDFKFYKIGKDSNWGVDTNKGKSLAGQEVGLLLQRFIQPTRIGGNRNFRARTNRYVSGDAYDYRTGIQNWSMYLPKGREFFAKAFTAAAYHRVTHGKTDEAQLKKTLVNRMGKAIKNYKNETNKNIGFISQNVQVYIEPVVMYDDNVWISYQTAARIRSRNYTLADVWQTIITDKNGQEPDGPKGYTVAKPKESAMGKGYNKYKFDIRYPEGMTLHSLSITNFATKSLTALYKKETKNDYGNYGTEITMIGPLKDDLIKAMQKGEVKYEDVKDKEGWKLIEATLGTKFPKGFDKKHYFGGLAHVTKSFNTGIQFITNYTTRADAVEKGGSSKQAYMTSEGGDYPGSPSRKYIGKDGCILLRRCDNYPNIESCYKGLIEHQNKDYTYATIKLKFKNNKGTTTKAYKAGAAPGWYWQWAQAQTKKSVGADKFKDLRARRINDLASSTPMNMRLLTSFAPAVEFDTMTYDDPTGWKLIQKDANYAYRKIASCLNGKYTRLGFAATGGWSTGGYYTWGGLYDINPEEKLIEDAEPKHLAVNVAVKLENPLVETDKTKQKDINTSFISSGDAYSTNHDYESDSYGADIGDDKPFTSLIADTNMLLDVKNSQIGLGTVEDYILNHFVSGKKSAYGTDTSTWSQLRDDKEYRATHRSVNWVDDLMFIPTESYKKVWNEKVGTYGSNFSASTYEIAKQIAYQRARYVGNSSTNVRLDDEWTVWSPHGEKTASTIYPWILNYTKDFYDSNHPMIAYWVGTTSIGTDGPSKTSNEGYKKYSSVKKAIESNIKDKTEIKYTGKALTDKDNPDGTNDTSIQFGKSFSVKLINKDNDEFDLRKTKGLDAFVGEYISSEVRSGDPIRKKAGTNIVPVGTDFAAGEIPGQYFGTTLLSIANNISMVDAAYNLNDYSEYTETKTNANKKKGVIGDDPFRYNFYPIQVGNSYPVAISVPKSLEKDGDTYIFADESWIEDEEAEEGEESEDDDDVDWEEDEEVEPEEPIGTDTNETLVDVGEAEVEDSENDLDIPAHPETNEDSDTDYPPDPAPEDSVQIQAYMDKDRAYNLYTKETKNDVGAKFRVVGELRGRRAQPKKLINDPSGAKYNPFSKKKTQYRMGIALEVYADMPRISSWYTSLTMAYNNDLTDEPSFLLPTDERYTDDALGIRYNLASKKGVSDPTKITFPNEGANLVCGSSNEDDKSPYSYYKTGKTEEHGGWDDDLKNFKTYEYSANESENMTVFFKNSSEDKTVFCYVFGVNNASSKLNTSNNYYKDGNQNKAWTVNKSGSQDSSILNDSKVHNSMVYSKLYKDDSFPTEQDYVKCMKKIIFKDGSNPVAGEDYFNSSVNVDTPVALGAFGNKADNPTKLRGATLYVFKVSIPKTIRAESDINLQDYQLNHWYSETFFTENLTANSGGSQLSITEYKKKNAAGNSSHVVKKSQGVKFISSDRNYLFSNPDNAIGGSLIRSAVIKPITLDEDKRKVVQVKTWEGLDLKADKYQKVKVGHVVPIPKLIAGWKTLDPDNQPETKQHVTNGKAVSGQLDKADVKLAMKQQTLRAKPTDDTWHMGELDYPHGNSSKNVSYYYDYYSWSEWKVTDYDSKGKPSGSHWESSSSSSHTDDQDRYDQYDDGIIYNNSSAVGHWSNHSGNHGYGTHYDGTLRVWQYQEMKESSTYRIFEVSPSNSSKIGSFGKIPKKGDTTNGGRQEDLNVANRVLASWAALPYADGYRAALYPGVEWKVHYNNGTAGDGVVKNNPSDTLELGAKSQNTFWAFNLNRNNFGDYRTISGISNNMSERLDTVTYTTNYLGNYFGLGTKQTSANVKKPYINDDASLGSSDESSDSDGDSSTEDISTGINVNIDDTAVEQTASDNDFLGMNPIGSLDPHNDTGTQKTVRYKTLEDLQKELEESRKIQKEREKAMEEAKKKGELYLDVDNNAKTQSAKMSEAKEGTFTNHITESQDPDNGDILDSNGRIKYSARMRNSLAYIHYGLEDTVFYSTRWGDSCALWDLSGKDGKEYNFSDEHRTNPAVVAEGTLKCNYVEHTPHYQDGFRLYEEHYYHYDYSSEHSYTTQTSRSTNTSYTWGTTTGHVPADRSSSSAHSNSYDRYSGGSVWRLQGYDQRKFTKTMTFKYTTLGERRPIKVKLLNAWNVYPNKILQASDTTDYFPVYGVYNELFEKIYKYQTAQDIVGISNLHYTDGKTEHKNYFKNPKYRKISTTQYKLDSEWGVSDNNNTIGFNSGIRGIGEYTGSVESQPSKGVNNLANAGQSTVSNVISKTGETASANRKVLYRMAVVNPNSGVYHTEDEGTGTYIAQGSGLLRFRPEVRMQASIPIYQNGTPLTTNNKDKLSSYTIQSVYTMGEVLRRIKTSAMYIVTMTSDTPDDLVNGQIYSDTIGSDTNASESITGTTNPVIYGGSDISLVVDSSKIKTNIVGYALDLADEEDGNVTMSGNTLTKESANVIVDSRSGGNAQTQFNTFIHTDLFKSGVGSYTKSFGTYADIVHGAAYYDSRKGTFPNMSRDLGNGKKGISNNMLLKSAWGNGLANSDTGIRAASKKNFEYFAKDVIKNITADIALKVPSRDSGDNKLYCAFNVSAPQMTTDISEASDLAYSLRIREGKILTSEPEIANAYPLYFKYEPETFNDYQTGHGGGGLRWLLDSIALDYGYTTIDSYSASDVQARIKAAKLFINSDVGTSLLRAIESNNGRYGSERSTFTTINAGSEVAKPFNNSRSGAYRENDFATSTGTTVYSGQAVSSKWGHNGGKTIKDLYQDGYVHKSTSKSLQHVSNDEDKHWYDEEVHTFVIRRYSMVASQMEQITLVDKVDFDNATDTSDNAGKADTQRGNINQTYDNKIAQWYLTFYFKEAPQFSACRKVYNPQKDGALTPNKETSLESVRKGNVLLENVWIKGADFAVPDETTDALNR